MLYQFCRIKPTERDYCRPTGQQSRSISREVEVIGDRAKKVHNAYYDTALQACSVTRRSSLRSTVALSDVAHVTDHIHAQLCTHDSTCLSKIIMPALSAACTHYKRRYFKLVNNKLIDSGGRFGGFAPQGLHVAPIGVKFGVEGRLFRAKFCPKPVQGWSVSPFTKC